jgi:hypothetical protein
MTTTPKISSIDPQSVRDREDLCSEPPVTDAGKREKSKYIKLEADQWKSMSSSSDVSDMLGAMYNVEETQAYGSGKKYAYASDRLLVFDPCDKKKILSPSEAPAVPDLYEDLLKNNPMLLDNMEPVVEKYDAQVKTYDELIKVANESLKKPLTVLEAQQTYQDLEALKYGRAEAQKNLEDAIQGLELQRAREKADREKAEAEL